MNGGLQWLLQANTNTITGPGTYSILGGQTQNGFTSYVASGKVIVQQLATPPSIFRYTETWNATAVSSKTVFTYDSPVFITGFLPLDGSQVNTLSPPSANAQATGFLFGVGNGIGEGYYLTPDGTQYFMTGYINTPFLDLGTYVFDTADFKKFGTDESVLDFPNVGGSVNVQQIQVTPEPGTLGLLGAGIVFLAGVRARRKK